MGGMGAVLSARAAEERNRFLGREWTGEEGEKWHKDLVGHAQERELTVWKQNQVCASTARHPQKLRGCRRGR